MYIDDEGSPGARASGPSHTATSADCLFESPTVVDQCNDYVMGKRRRRSEADNHFGHQWSGKKAHSYYLERW